MGRLAVLLGVWVTLVAASPELCAAEANPPKPEAEKTDKDADKPKAAAAGDKTAAKQPAKDSKDSKAQPKKAETAKPAVIGKIDDKAADKNEEKTPEEELEEFMQGATLETDSEIDRLLTKAKELLGEGQDSEALIILQHILDQGGDAVTSTDKRVYKPVRRAVEGMLRALSAESLRLYRVSADAHVSGLLAETKDLEVTLRQVVARYFISSQGDDAAVQLAGLAIDRGQGSVARRYLRRVLEEHPDASFSPAMLHARLTVACLLSGDQTAAKEHWQQVGNGSGLSDELRQGIAAWVAGETEVTTGSVAVAALWPVGDGFSGRDGSQTMQFSASSAADNLWVPQWDARFPLMAKPLPKQVQDMVKKTTSSSRYSSRSRTQPAKVERDDFVAVWEEQGLIPTSRPAVADGKAFIRDHDGLRCVDLNTGRQLWQLADFRRQQPAPKEDGKNQATVRRFFGSSYYNGRGNGLPFRENKSFFTDRLGQQVTVIGKTVYQIENNYLNVTGRSMGNGFVMINGRAVRQNQADGVGNHLSAVDVENGQVRWRVGRSKSADDPFFECRILGTPVACRQSLLVAAERRGELILFALNAADGSVRWQRFLGALVQRKGSTPITVDILVEDGEAYIASGRGLLLAVDGIGGELLWASRYARDLGDGVQATMWRHMSYALTKGWAVNRAMVVGDQVVVAPKDAAALIAFDRQSGEVTYRADIEKAVEVIGRHQDQLVVLANGQIQSRYLSDGSEAWSVKAPRRTGRGLVTQHEVLVPAGRQLHRYDVSNGKELPGVFVARRGADPIGNLVALGDDILVSGLDRLYRLRDSRQRFADLNARLVARADDYEALLHRGQLFHQAGSYRKAAEDLRRVADSEVVSDVRTAAIAGLIDSLLDLLNEHPSDGATLVAELERRCVEAGDRQRLQLAQASWHEACNDVAAARQAYVALGQPAEEQSFVETGENGLRISMSHQAMLALRRLRMSSDAEQIAAAERELADYVHSLRTPPVPKNTVEDGGQGAEGSGEGVQTVVAPPTKRKLDPLLEARLAALYPGTETGRELLFAACEKLIQAKRLPEALSLWQQATLGKDKQDVLAAWNTMRDYFSTAGWTAAASQAESALATYDALDATAEFDGRAAWSGATPMPPEKGSMPKGPWAFGWHAGKANSRLVFMDFSHELPFMQEHFLMLSDSNQRMSLHRLSDGKEMWSKTLPKVEGRRSNSFVLSYRQYSSTSTSNIVGEGLIGVARSASATMGIDMMSGKILWSVPKPTALNTSRSHVYYSYTRQRSAGGFVQLSVGQGKVAELYNGRQVRVLDLVTGKVLWQIKRRTASFTGLRVHPQAIAVTRSQNNKVLFLNPEDGSVISDATVVNNYYRSTLWTETAMINQIYQAGGAHLEAVAVPSGESLWKAKLGTYLQGMELLQDGTIVGWNRSRHLVALDSRDGSEIWKSTIDATGYMNRFELSRDRKQLFVCLYENIQQNKTTRKVKLSVVTASTKTGRESGRVTLDHEFQSQASAWVELIDAEQDLVIVSARQIKMNGRRTQYLREWKMHLFRLSDGKRYDQNTLPAPYRGQYRSYRRPMVTFGNRLLLMDEKGLHAVVNRNEVSAERLKKQDADAKKEAAAAKKEKRDAEKRAKAEAAKKKAAEEKKRKAAAAKKKAAAEKKGAGAEKKAAESEDKAKVKDDDAAAAKANRAEMVEKLQNLLQEKAKELEAEAEAQKEAPAEDKNSEGKDKADKKSDKSSVKVKIQKMVVPQDGNGVQRIELKLEAGGE